MSSHSDLHRTLSAGALIGGLVLVSGLLLLLLPALDSFAGDYLTGPKVTVTALVLIISGAGLMSLGPSGRRARGAAPPADLAAITAANAARGWRAAALFLLGLGSLALVAILLLAFGSPAVHGTERTTAILVASLVTLALGGGGVLALRAYRHALSRP